MPRYITDHARKFVIRGKLMTTVESAQFFVDNDIEPDNGQMTIFESQPQVRTLMKEYHVRIAFSPLHVLHPYDAIYFDPKGHPLASAMRSRYVRKKREPLWIMFTSRSAGLSTVVRTVTQGRLHGALRGSLEALGYTLAPGLASDKAIWGTLWVSMLDPIATSALSHERFGKEIAAALDKECSFRT